jgi:hypothetical protein
MLVLLRLRRPLHEEGESLGNTDCDEWQKKSLQPAASKGRRSVVERAHRPRKTAESVPARLQIQYQSQV